MIAALLATAVLAAPSTEAGTARGQLRVTAKILGGCALEGGEVNFGQYIAGQANDKDVIGEIRFSDCIGNLSFELDDGLNSGFGQRRMISGSNTLNYELYKNGYTARWGTGVQKHGTNLFSVQDGKMDVYARIPGGQTAPPGDYADTVTITMSF